MKLLMWHCKKFDVKLTENSDRPKDINPEPKRSEHESMKNCIVSMITVENKDETEAIQQATEEMRKFAQDTGSKNIVLMPFVHLSSKIADSKKTMDILQKLENALKDLKTLRSHFGYHKELILHTFGHKTNVRFREF